MNPPKVSVIVPFAHVSDSIDACMDSILGQTLAGLEILCVAADAEALACAESYAGRDARVKVLRAAEGGMAAMMNLAIRSASGIYVGFVAAGDGIAPTMYETLVQFADAHPQADVVKADYVSVADIDGTSYAIHRRRLVGARANDYGILLNPRKHAYLFGIDGFCGAGIYRRSFLTRYNLRHREAPDDPFSEHGFGFQTLALAQGVTFLPQIVCCHQEREPVRAIRVQEMRSLCDEYDFIEQRLRIYRGVPEAVRVPYLRKRYEACAWALRCVEAAARPAIVQKMQEDFARRIAEERDIDRMFSPTFCRRRNKELRLLLQDAEAYRAYIEKQLQDISQRQKALASWAARKPLMIVGTGTLGEIAQVLLARHGVPAVAFVRSDAADAASFVNGVPVRSFEQIDALQGMRFLVAVEKNGKAIKERLQAAGAKASGIKSFELWRLSWDA